MKTTLKKEDNYNVMYFEGRLTTAAAVQTETETRVLNEDTDQDIILDCSKLEYISSSGLRIFLGILKKAKARGAHVYIRGLNNEIKQVFTMTGFSSLFELK